MATLLDMLYGNDALYGNNPGNAAAAPTSAPAPVAPVAGPVTPTPLTASPIPAVYAQPGIQPSLAPTPKIGPPAPITAPATDPQAPALNLTPQVGSTAASYLDSTPQTDTPRWLTHTLENTPTWNAGNKSDAPIQGYPSGPFDRPIDPVTGTPMDKATWNAHIDSDPNAADNTWANRHTDLRRGLATLFAGMTEYAGDRMGKPGMGAAQLAPVVEQAQQARQWLTNRPALQEQANVNFQKEQADANLKTAQASYYGMGGPTMGKAITAGYVIDPVTKQPVPITNLSATQQSTVDKNNAALANSGLKRDENGNIVPETDRSKLPLPVQSKLDVQDSEQNLKQAQTELAQAGNDPNSPLYKLKLAQVQMAQQHLSLAYAANDRANRDFYVKTYGVDPGHTGGGGGVAVAPGSAPVSTGMGAMPPASGAPPAATPAQASKGVPTNADGTAMTPYTPKQKDFNKSYVNPAQSVEKSYQMMDNAYNEYKAAAAQGKDLPTGAQSMVALSTHLSTTFGNVKGARITKDMIQEHLGARSVSDSALVAMQKLTNGDVLSPDQWDAFHGLISQSRGVTWSQAVDEANREHLPIDFLPKDLQPKYASTPKAGNSGANSGADPFAQFGGKRR